MGVIDLVWGFRVEVRFFSLVVCEVFLVENLAID